MTEEWVTEKWPNIETRYRIKALLHEEKSEFQHLQLVDTHEFGKMLILDGLVQTTEGDEFIYHEMMTHIPMMAHPEPKSVLIIGGGDGGVLREVLKHPSVRKAVMVEIDSRVVEFSKKHLPSINNGAFEDPRSELIFDDGAKYVGKTDEHYDVVIVDSSDPIGPAEILFSREFYENIRRVLNPAGIMVRQTGSLQLQPDEQKMTYQRLKDVFHFVSFYVFAVPTYVGGFFSSVFCSDTVDPLKTSYEQLLEKSRAISLSTHYYHSGIHTAAFQVPIYLKGVVK